MRRISVSFFFVLIFVQTVAGQTAQLVDTVQAMVLELGPPGALAGAALATTAIVCEAVHNYATQVSKKPDFSQQPVHTTIDTIGLETGFVPTTSHSFAPSVTQAQIVQAPSPTIQTTLGKSKIFVPENTQVLDTLPDLAYQRTGVHDSLVAQATTFSVPAKIFHEDNVSAYKPLNVAPTVNQQKKLDHSIDPQTESQKAIPPKQESTIPQITPIPNHNSSRFVITTGASPSAGRMTGQEYQRIESIKNWFRRATSTMTVNLSSYGSAFEKAREYYLKNHVLPNITNEQEWQNFGPVMKKYFTRYVLEEQNIGERPGKGLASKIAKLFSKKHKTKIAHKQATYDNYRNGLLEEPYRLFDVVWVWTNPYMSQQNKDKILSQMEVVYAQKQVYLLQEVIAALPQSIREELALASGSFEEQELFRKPIRCGDTGNTAKMKQIHGCGSTAIAGVEFNIQAIHDMLKKCIIPSDVARIIKYDQPIQEIDRATLIYCNQKDNIVFDYNKNSKTVMHVGRYSDMVLLNASGDHEQDTNVDTLVPNSIKHIIEGSKGHDHKWQLLVPDKSWDKIKEVIKDVIRTGAKRPYKNGDAYVNTKIINGQIVEIIYVVDETSGKAKIGNGWVK